MFHRLLLFAETRSTALLFTSKTWVRTATNHVLLATVEAAALLWSLRASAFNNEMRTRSG